MTALRRTVPVFAATAGLLLAAAPAIGHPTPQRPAGHGASTGTIKVYVIHDYGNDHAKGRKICALKPKKRHGYWVPIGKCGIVNSSGHVVLKKVPAGAVRIGAFDEEVPPDVVFTAAKHVLHVHPGKTTSYTWHFNEIPTS